MKKILQILLIGIICYYTYNSYREFKEKSFFKITTINVKVKNKELVADLLKDIDYLKGMNILRIDSDEIKNKILEDIRVKDVIIKKGMPDSIFFEIVEKNPFTYVEYKGKIYISDKNGTIYGKMRESKKYNMPLLRVSDEKELKEFLGIMEKIQYKDKISQIYKEKNKVIITINTGLKIITNKDVEAKKYEIVENLFERDDNFNMEYVDLRFKDYIIKRVEGDQR